MAVELRDMRGELMKIKEKIMHNGKQFATVSDREGKYNLAITPKEYIRSKDISMHTSYVLPKMDTMEKINELRKRILDN